MATALDVAFVFLAAAPSEDFLTNLKLQKLCAYAQAVSLAYAGQPLFEEDIEAWTHGPVVPSVYEKFKDNGAQPLAPPFTWEVACEKLNEPETFIVQMVWTAYGRFTAWALRDLSHWDFPGRFGSKMVISKDAIKSAFAGNRLVKMMRQNDMLNEAQHALDL